MSIDGFGEPIELTSRPDWWPSTGKVRWAYGDRPYQTISAEQVHNFGAPGESVLVRLPAGHPHYSAPVATPAPKYPEALVERAMKLVRIVSEWTWTNATSGHVAVAEARAIVADLPVEVDEDLMEARRIAASRSERSDVSHADYLSGDLDSGAEVQGYLAAIKRGRALADADAGRRE